MTEYLAKLAQLNIGIVGLGVSGYACAKFLLDRGCKPFVVDSDLASQNVAKCREQWPSVVIDDFANCQAKLNQADMLIVSPGIAVAHPALVEAKVNGVEIIGDVELFARLNNKPVIAITGSNGKSSVTTLVTLMLQKAGLAAEYGGNIGVSALTLLDSGLDVIVLELSSFQLETTTSLACASATVLNVVEDHMDRYDDFAVYVAAKQRIYRHSRCQVFNRDDANTVNQLESHGACEQGLSFGLDKPPVNGVGIEQQQLVVKFDQQTKVICGLSEVQLQGQHNVQNALAAIALVAPFKLDNRAIVSALGCFDGLPHRCQQVSVDGEVEWINDSKGTNVGATVAAIESVRPRVSGRMALIAGGDGKQADFAPLKAVMADKVDYLITFGEDGDVLDRLYSGDKVSVNGLDEAVSCAKRWAKADDCVMFSPACASGVMFRNYIERGESFIELVQGGKHVH